MNRKNLSLRSLWIVNRTIVVLVVITDIHREAGI